MKRAVIRGNAVFLGATLAALAIAGTSAAGPNDEKEECIAAADEGQTLRDASKLLEARERFARCVRDTCPGALRKDCAQFLESIDAALPGLVITATDAAGHELAAVKVTEKDKVIAERLDGRAIVLDPGEHLFRFTAEGKTPVDKTMIVKQGDKNQTLMVRFEGPADGNEPIKTTAPPAIVRTEGGGWGTQKTIGITVGIVGVVGTIVGGVFGGLAASSWNDAKAKCGTACTANDPAQETLAAARTNATFSTTFFIAGPLLIATGVVVFLTAPSSNVSASVSPTANGFVVSGRF